MKSGSCWELQASKLSSNYLETRLTKDNLMMYANLFTEEEITSSTKNKILYFHLTETSLVVGYIWTIFLMTRFYCFGE